MTRKIHYKIVLFLLLCILQSAHSQQDTTKIVMTAEDQTFERALIDEMDEMLDLWYVKREMAHSHSILSKFHDDTLTTETSDSVIIARIQQMSSPIQLGFNDRVKHWVNLYLKRKRSASAILGMAQYYYPWMKEIFDKYHVPEELVYITIIESALNPVAVSRAGATGIWQFMYTTGKMYGLEVNTFIDDRRDPVKATDAAARHFRDLYKMFGDWGMAIAAYNSGPGNVRKAIQRSGGKNDFWGIANYLPRETQNYFPAFIGAYYMMTYHSIYGIKSSPIVIPTAVDTVMIHKELHLEQVAHVLNIDIEEIKLLNPQYKRLLIPAFDKPYPLKLRQKDIIRFLDMKDSIYAYEHDVYFEPLTPYINIFTGTPNSSDTKKKMHTVKSGETLSKIALKYGLSVEELKKMNKLKSNYIKPKSRLVVGYENEKKEEENPPQKSGTEQPATASDSTQTAQNSATSSPQKTTTTPTIYVVKKGDTMSAIAQKHGTTARALADYNGITNMNALKVGQKLKIPKK